MKRFGFSIVFMFDFPALKFLGYFWEKFQPSFKGSSDPFYFWNQCRKESDPTLNVSEIEWWISRLTLNRLKWHDSKFRVVLCRTRPFPTLFPKIISIWSEVPLTKLMYLHHALKMHYLKPEICIPQYEVRRFVLFYQIHIVWIVRQKEEHFYLKYKMVPMTCPMWHWMISTPVASSDSDFHQAIGYEPRVDGTLCMSEVNGHSSNGHSRKKI